MSTRRRYYKNSRKTKSRQFIYSLNNMQIICFALAGLAVLLGLILTFRNMSGSRRQSSSVSAGDSLIQNGSVLPDNGSSSGSSVNDDWPETSSALGTTAPKTSEKTAATSPKKEPSLLETIQPHDHSAEYFIVVYKKSQSVAVYGKDKNNAYTKEIKIFTCSTGKKSSPTRTGKYSVRAKYRWRWLEGRVYGQYNTSISDDYLFHSVPYLQKDASTLDESEYDKLGTPASKGCIRLCVRDCKWIYDNCSVGTEVRIVDDSGPSGSGVPARVLSSDYSGWDPSDEWSEGNPYFQ